MGRELVYTGFISLDGVVDSPGAMAEGHRSGGWVMNTPFAPEAFALKGEELADTTALMFGRRSYEAFAPIWRDSEDHGSYQEFPKYVVSTTLTEGDLFEGWGPTTILRSSDEVARLKETNGGGIFIHGSAELARRLSDENLIDRYNLLLFPILLGAGKTIFSSADRESKALSLRECERYSNGVTKLIFDVTN